MSPDDPRHGTYAGAQRHRIDGGAVNPNQAMSNKARGRALSRLARAHREEYVVLYAQELGKERAR